MELPDAVYDLLLKILNVMEEGKAISIVPVMQDLTTQQAAELLGVSRPFFVKLLETGNLPKYDGREVLQQIRADPGLTHMPVVILTTSSSEEDVLRSYKLHANAFVTKPVDVNQFIAAVRQIDEFFLSVARLPRS